jgi:predicted dehydrogenase
MVMNRVGVAMIGLGLAVKPHALALRDLAQRIDFLGGFSPSETRRSAFHRQYDLPVFDSLDALLADPRVQAILILTPPRTHAAVAAQAVRAGKHILLEKPVDVNLDGARRTVEAVASAGLKLGVVFQHRYRGAVLTLRDLLAQGEIGEIISASASVRWWRGPDYFAQPGRGILARDGGGVLLTQAIHTLDVLLNLVGPAEEVTASCKTSALRAIDTEDVACATVRYRCGALGVIDATTVAYPGYPERVEIAGTRGSAVLEAGRLLVHRAGKASMDIAGSSQGGGGADPMAFSHEPHRALLEDFVDAIQTGREALASGRSALPVHALIDAILESSRIRQPVKVRDALG